MRFIEESNLDLTKTEDFLEWMKINNEESILNREDDTKWLRTKNIPFDNCKSELDKMIKSTNDPTEKELFEESKGNVDTLSKLYDERFFIDEFIDYYKEEVNDESLIN